MKVAVAYENGEIFLHFGRTEQFKVYELENGRVVSSEMLDSNGNGHGALVDVLKEAGVNALICGGIGMGARNALESAGIALYPGVTGEADAAAKAFAAGLLQYDPDAHCDHHGHHAPGQDCYSHASGQECRDHDKE